MREGANRPKERAEEHDYVTRSPVAERQRSVQPYHKDAHTYQVCGADLVYPANDIVGYVEDEEEDRKEAYPMPDPGARGKQAQAVW
mgnify:CR=1 FL=1